MKLNRRKVLASLGLIGAGAATGAVGTRAVFSDTESTTVTTTAGELDLKLDWKAIHNGNQIAMQTPTDADGEVAASFDDVKPGDTGCFSLSLHNETNPAWVWLALDITGESDGGNGGGDDDQGLDCPPVQYPWVCGQHETDGYVTVDTDGDNLVIDIQAASGETLNETHVHIGTQLSDIPGNNGGPQPGQFDYKHESLGTSDDSYTIPLTDVGAECGDELLIAVHAAQSDGETCWAGSTELTGNNWALGLYYTVCCGDSSSSTGGSTGSGSVLADNILVDVFWDDDHDCELDADEQAIFQNITLRNLASNMNKASGGIMPQWFSTGTQYVSFVWRIPVEVGNEIQGDTVDLKYSAYAVQRRHNENPDNPWT